MRSLYDCDLLHSLNTSESNLQEVMMFDLQQTIANLKHEYNDLLEQNKVLETRMAEKDSLLDTTKQDYEDVLDDFRQRIEDLKKRNSDNENMLNASRQQIEDLKRLNSDNENMLNLKKISLSTLEERCQSTNAAHAYEMKLLYQFLIEKEIEPREWEQLDVPTFKRFGAIFSRNAGKKIKQ